MIATRGIALASCFLAGTLSLSPARAADGPKKTLWLQVEAAGDTEAVTDVVRRVMADSARFELVDRTVWLGRCCSETACLVDEMMKKGAEGSLVVRAGRSGDVSLAVAKIVYPALTRMPRAFAFERGEPAQVAEKATRALLQTTPPAAGTTRIAMIPTPLYDGAPFGSDLFDEFLLASLTGAGPVDGLGSLDIQDLLGREFQAPAPKDGRPTKLCATDIMGPWNTNVLIVTNMGRLGKTWAIASKAISIEKTEVLVRSNEVIEGGVEQLVGSFPKTHRGLLEQIGIR